MLAFKQPLLLQSGYNDDILVLELVELKLELAIEKAELDSLNHSCGQLLSSVHQLKRSTELADRKEEWLIEIEDWNTINDIFLHDNVMIQHEVVQLERAALFLRQETK